MIQNTAERPTIKFLPKISWAGYDFANTIYSFIVFTLAGVRYFESAGVNGELFYGIAFFISMVTSGFIVPVLGAICDRIGYAKLGVILMTVITITTMILMSLTQDLTFLFILLFLGNISYQTSLVLYDTLLPLLIKNNKEAGKLSGLGVGLGYLGSIVSVALIMALLPNVMFKQVGTEIEIDRAKSAYTLEILDSEENVITESTRTLIITEDKNFTLLSKHKPKDSDDVPAFIITEKNSDKLIISAKSGEIFSLTYTDEKFADAFLLGAGLFFIASLPFLFFVPEKRIFSKNTKIVKIKSPIKQVFSTLKTLPKNKPLLFFLIGAFLCQDVQNTAISFLSIVAKKVYNPSEASIILFLLFVNLSAAFFAFMLGFAADKFGAKRVLIVSAFSILVSLLTIVILPSNLFFVMALVIIIGGGLGIAGFWTAGRKLLLQLAPPEQISEYFGFYNLTRKLSVLGIVLMPTIRLIASEYFIESTSYRIAILSQLPLLILGIIFLSLIKFKE